MSAPSSNGSSKPNVTLGVAPSARHSVFVNVSTESLIGWPVTSSLASALIGRIGSRLGETIRPARSTAIRMPRLMMP